MPGATRVAVIGRSIRDIAAVWSTLQPFFSSADLVVTEDPAARALDGPGTPDGAVFAILDQEADLERLEHLGVAPDWLCVLCPPALMQTRLAELNQFPFAVLPVADAALALMGTSAAARRRYSQPSSRELQ